MIPLFCDILIIAEQNKKSLHGSDPVGAFPMSKGGVQMGYRKVGYLEQIWYILRYKFRQHRRKEDTRAK